MITRYHCFKFVTATVSYICSCPKSFWKLEFSCCVVCLLCLFWLNVTCITLWCKITWISPTLLGILWCHESFSKQRFAPAISIVCDTWSKFAGQYYSNMIFDWMNKMISSSTSCRHTKPCQRILPSSQKLIKPVG